MWKPRAVYDKKWDAACVGYFIKFVRNFKLLWKLATALDFVF